MVEGICNYIIDNDIVVSWRAATRIDLIDLDLLGLMKKAGCYQLSIGIETNQQQSLNLTNKNINIEAQKLAVDLIHQAGIEVFGLFMGGMPGESEESLRKLARYAIGLRVDYAQFNELDFSPGADIYDEYASGKLQLLPKELVRAELKRARYQFYWRFNYFMKQIKKIKTLDDLTFTLRTIYHAFLANF